MSWRVTQPYGDVAASRPTCSRWVARLSLVRIQSAGAGTSLETTRSALGAHLSAVTYSWATAAAAAAVSHVVLTYKLPRQVNS